MNLIVDTCVWSQFLRRNTAPPDPISTELARLVRADVVRMLGPIRQELLSGAHPAERFEQLREWCDPECQSTLCWE